MKSTSKMTTLLGVGVGLVAILGLAGSAAAQAPPKHTSHDVPETAKHHLLKAYGELPLQFEANQGQTNPQVKFLSRGRGYVLFLMPTEAILSLNKPQSSAGAARRGGIKDVKPQNTGRTVVRMGLVGANPSPQIVGMDELAGKSHYFIGHDSKKWRTNVPVYARVEVRNVYPSVNLVYYGNQRRLEYDFVVVPGADPKTIVLGFQGADKLEIDDLGDLVLHIAGSKMRLRRPILYQEIDGVRQEVSGGYLLKDKHQVGFHVAAYDAARTLVIDPVLVYSSYLGGSNAEGANAGGGIAVDGAGNAYVTGTTRSLDFPTVNPLQPTCSPDEFGYCYDAFVTKLNAAGSALVHSTFLGGSGHDIGTRIAVDAAGTAYVTGYTGSSDFPTRNAVQPVYGGDWDAFVTKIGSEKPFPWELFIPAFIKKK